MRELAKAQAASGLHAGVGFGVIRSRNWPLHYEAELRSLGLPFYLAQTLQAFGTAQFLWQRWRKPPIGKWVEELAAHCGTSSVVIHFHNAWMSGVFLPLRQNLSVRTKVVSTFHGVNAALDGQPVRHALHRWMAQRLIRFETSLTSVDDWNLKLAERLFGLNPLRFVVIPNGVPAPVHEAPSWKGQGEFLLGHLGTISERKGWHIAAQATRQAAGTGRRIRLLIAGIGPEEAAARKVAEESNGVVEYVGHVAKPSVDFLPQLHALAVMSAHEGLPVSIIEALAAGVPVLATAVGGIPSALGKDRAGWLVEREVQKLAAAIIQLHDSPRDHARLKAGAKGLFVERFNIADIVKQYDAVYRLRT
jgi:glycosyltransferase involved in cell wall biosynthesis